MRAGQHQVGPGHQGGEGNSPGVGVEHRHHHERPVAFADRVSVSQARDHRVQVQRSVGIADALGAPVVPEV